jgi:hypothetical protein
VLIIRLSDCIGRQEKRGSGPTLGIRQAETLISAFLRCPKLDLGGISLRIWRAGEMARASSARQFAGRFLHFSINTNEVLFLTVMFKKFTSDTMLYRLLSPPPLIEW